MNKKLLYFHGSTLPPETDSKEIRKPSFDRPFFVADNLDAAIDYAIETGKDNASIFILVAKRPLHEIAFDISSKGYVESLSKKFPKLVKFIDKYRKTGFFTRFSGPRSFYDIICYLAASLKNAASILGGDQILQTFKVPNAKPSFNDSDPFSSAKQYAVDIVNELGLAHISGDMVKLDNELYFNLTNKDKDSLFTRRLIKSKIYEEIYKLGFHVVMDDDTTAMGLDGNEYAILDMDVLEGGFSKSYPMDGIKKVIRKIGEMQ